MIEHLVNGDVVLTDEVTQVQLVLERPTREELRAAKAAFFPPATVPMYKVRKVLEAQGLMAGVLAAIDGLPEPNRTYAKIDFEYAPNLVRAAPLVQNLRAALGLTHAQLDNLIRVADATP